MYNYCNSEETAKSGANWVLEKLKGKSLELPVYIDMEDNSIAGLGKDKLTNICIAFNTIIEKNGFWAGVYANLNWFNNYLNKDEIKKRYTCWIAHYTSGNEKYKGEYDIWQNSSSGKINGINGNVDTNYMYRDLVAEIANRTATTVERKSNEEIAREVMDGKWDVYPRRKQLLEQAGYNYAEVQAIVNRIYGANKQRTYTVKSGDTLSGIGAKLGVNWQNIASKNGIKSPYRIYPGQVLKI